MFAKMPHTHVILLSLGQMSRMPLIGIVMVFLIGFSLALPTSVFVIFKNIQSVNQLWPMTNSPIFLYLKSPITESQVLALSKKIQMHVDVKKVDYVSPEQGLIDFQKKTGMTNLIGVLKENPLPALFIVMPKTDDPSSPTLIHFLQTLPSVQTVKYHSDLSGNLRACVLFLQHLFYGLIYCLSFSAMLIMGSLVFWMLKAHAQDINSYHLVGKQSDCIPELLIYLGLLYGLMGGVFGYLIATIGLDLLEHAIITLGNLYNASISWQGLDLKNGMMILVASMLIGFVSAILANKNRFFCQSKKLSI